MQAPVLQLFCSGSRSLEGNYIYGEIPLELGKLSSLEILSLGTNDFSGSIPDSFGSLRKLQKL
jgi:hypothetical protein